jgi:hypothetical protein
MVEPTSPTLTIFEGIRAGWKVLEAEYAPGKLLIIDTEINGATFIKGYDKENPLRAKPIDHIPSQILWKKVWRERK